MNQNKKFYIQVITFNDKKCTLGSIGMAQITKLENQVI